MTERYSFVVVAVLFLAGLPSSAHTINNTPPNALGVLQQTKTTPNPLLPSIAVQPIRVQVYRFGTGTNAQTARSESGVKWTDVAIVALTVILAGCGIAATIVARLQWLALREQVHQLEEAVKAEEASSVARARETGLAIEIAKRSADAAIMAQRPWVMPIVEIAGPLTISKTEGVRLEIVISLHNSGNTPAVDVSVIPRIAAIPVRNGLDFRVAVVEALAIAENWRNAGVRRGTTIFPKITTPPVRKNVVTCPIEELKQAASSSDEDSANQAILLLGGVVNYYFGSDRGETTFNFVIMSEDSPHLGFKVEDSVFQVGRFKLLHEEARVYAK